jgi:hypothetical protein
LFATACTGPGTASSTEAPAGTAAALAPSLNAAPSIQGQPPSTVIAGTMFSFRPSASDADGDRLVYSVRNRSAWMSFDDRTGELSGTPAIGDVGNSAAIIISVSDGKATASMEAFVITVLAPPNRPPSITGSPSTTAIVGQRYVFAVSSADPDADRLVHDILGRPRWAEFDAATGRLEGIPTSGDIGTTGEIRIGVSDGRARASLDAFVIQVQPVIPPAPPPPSSDAPAGTNPSSGTTSTAGASTGAPGAASPPRTEAPRDRVTSTEPSPPPPSGATARTAAAPGAARDNRAPEISGVPPTSVAAGQAYVFVPTAADADDDPLTFAVSNRPDWASFDPRSGRLSGTPAATDVGTYSGIGISVTDGRASDALQTFTITVRAGSTGSVTLDWEPTTTNSDGSPLRDLAGYRLRYGTSTASLDRVVDIPNAGLSTYVLDGLAPGVWYFVLRAYNHSGTEGLPSNMASRALE